MIQCYRGLCGGKVDYKIIQLCRCWSLELSVIIQSKHGQVNGPLRRSRGRGLNYFIIITIISPSGVWPERWGRGPGHTMLHHHLERGEKTERRGVTGHCSLHVIIWGGDMSRAGIRDAVSDAGYWANVNVCPNFPAARDQGILSALLWILNGTL